MMLKSTTGSVRLANEPRQLAELHAELELQ